MSKIDTSLLVLFFLLINNTYGQELMDIKNSEVKGIYLTLENFKNNKLICSVDYQQKIIKIKLKQFFISPEISCIELDKETVYYKDSIFAIKLSNDENFRFLNRTPCLIADTLFLYIYTYKTIKREYKQYGPARRAKEIPVTYYYFSTGDHQDIYTLTLSNLYKYLHFDPHIQTAISQKFINDEMLYSINQKSGHFLLNEFLVEFPNKKY